MKYLKNHNGKILWRSKKTSIIECKTCGFSHLKPIPKIEELEKMYVHKFYQNLKPKYIKKDESELSYWNLTFDDKLEILEKHVKGKKKKILDIGCGAGFFLNRAKQRSWNTVGIEPSPIAAKYARSNGIEIIQTTFEKFLTQNSEKFDVIHSKFFLEHVREPETVCKSCFKILKKNGIICFEVPNDFNLLQKIVTENLKKNSYWVAPPEHINYFSPLSLQKLLKKTGFKILYTESTFPLEFFLLFGLDYLNNDKIGKKIHSMRMNFESILHSSGNNALKRELYSYLAKQGLGREIIVYAQKN